MATFVNVKTANKTEVIINIDSIKSIKTEKGHKLINTGQEEFKISNDEYNKIRKMFHPKFY